MVYRVRVDIYRMVFDCIHGWLNTDSSVDFIRKLLPAIGTEEFLKFSIRKSMRNTLIGISFKVCFEKRGILPAEAPWPIPTGRNKSTYRVKQKSAWHLQDTSRYSSFLNIMFSTIQSSNNTFKLSVIFFFLYSLIVSTEFPTVKY